MSPGVTPRPKQQSNDQTIRSLGQMIEVLLIRHEAKQSGKEPCEPPAMDELIEVEVLDGHVTCEGTAEWRHAHCRRILPDGRFMVCVHTPEDEPDEEFMEWYTRHDE